MHVLLTHLPADSAVAMLGQTEPPWTRDQVLLADVWQQVARSKTPHPSLKNAQKQAATRRTMTPERRRKLADARRRARERRERLAAQPSE